MSTAQASTDAPSWRPAGYHSVTPQLNIDKDAALKALDWYERVFSATRINCHVDQKGSGKVAHATLRIGDSIVFVNDVFDEWRNVSGPVSSSFYVYVEHVDELYKKALQDGAVSKYEPKDQFWGDRTACVVDPFGQSWTMAHPIPGFVGHHAATQ